MSSAQLTTEFLERIEKKIEEIEQICSLEIVPVIVDRSSEYAGFRFTVSIIVAFVGFLVMTIEGGLSPVWNLGISLVLSGIFAFGLTWSAILRLFLPEVIKAEAVEHTAQSYFLHEEVFATRMRTGVMIFISEFERSVFLLADKGLTDRIPARRWAELGAQLAEDFSKKQSGQTFLEALTLLSQTVAPDFPPLPDDEDELSNEVRGMPDQIH